MNGWLIGATALLAGMVPCTIVALRGTLLDALVAVELAGTVMTLVLVLLAEGFHRSAYYTLPVVLSALAPIGTLLFVRFFGERWL